jgi:ADP-ribosylglycohydrolase
MDLVEELIGAPFEAKEPEAGPPPANPAIRHDRVSGMLYGVALGDALGAPHEFRNQVPLARYSGGLEHALVVVRRFQGGRLVGSVGQITDDTEMMLALADAVVAGGGAYDAGRAVARYLAWANSRCPFLGNNTRRLFTGVKTYEGYRGRWQAARAEPPAAWSQANGCLMRCAPLAALPDEAWEDAVAADCALTNFHPVCLDGVRAYVGAARALLAGGDPAEATAAALALAREPDVVAVIASARDGAPRLVADERKGWILHALHCAFYALNLPLRTFQERIDLVVRLGGDTDTNGAIAGALLGALYGAAAMRAETRTGPNLDIILAVDPAEGDLPRPPRYAARRLPEVADALAAL